MVEALQPFMPPELHRASDEVETILDELAPRIQDEHLQTIFESCFADPLNDIIDTDGTNDMPFTYIETGDIHAMWLRDSAVQMAPYIRFARPGSALRRLVLGTINQQTKFVTRDPYANAFVKDEIKIRDHADDKTDMNPGVYERKWEPDSLSHVIHFAYRYWKETGDASFVNQEWEMAMRSIVKAFEDQQRLHGRGDYSFTRPFAKAISLFTGNTNEVVPNDGWGEKTAKIGLIHSTHRPSDDANKLPFNIPENLFAASALTELADMSQDLLHDESFTQKCRDLAATMHSAVAKYGVVDGPDGRKIYAFEIDGFEGEEHVLIMDDANIPGFLSLPYLIPGIEQDEIYRNTRAYSLSQNAYYFERGKLAGVGSPHTGGDRIWPLSIIFQALTSRDEQEIRICLSMLRELATSEGKFNESVSVSNTTDRTRNDFGMANSMMAELLLQLVDKHEELLQAV